MIYRRGQLDQIITSVIVLFAVFWLMVLFVNISANIGKVEKVISGNNLDAEKFSSPIKRAESRALLDMFLSDDIEIAGEKVNVREVLSALVAADSASDKTQAPNFAKGIEKLFAEDYSCNGRNVLIVAIPDGFTSGGYLGKEEETYEKVTVYINYPVERAEEFPRVRLVYDAGSVGGVYGSYESSEEAFANYRVDNAIVWVRGGLRC